MILQTAPYPWNSAHRPVEYVYDHESRFISGVTIDTGNLVVHLTSMFANVPVVGDRVVLTGVLDLGVSVNGIYDVLAVSGSTVTLDLAVTTPTLSAPSTLKFIRLPEVKLYSGYLPLEEYPADLPLTLVATFYPENSPDNDVRIDVSEFLKSIFRIEPPVEGIDFNMFSRFRLYFDGAYKDFYMVLNSSIKTESLNALYVNTGAYLNSQIPPIVFGCGKTILSTLQGSVVVNVYSDNGDIVGLWDYSANDYDSADYFTE